MAGIKDATLQPKGYVQDTTISTATAIASVVPAGATRVLIKVTGQPVRWRDDGVDPTASVGMLIDVGDELWYTGQVRALRFIETAASAVLDMAFYA